MDTRERKYHILQLRENSPHISLAEIARDVGLSRERVRQLFNEWGIPTISPAGCLRCGIVPRKYIKNAFCSMHCYKVHQRSNLHCSHCNGIIMWHKFRDYCSDECYKAAYTLVCEICGKEFATRRGEYNARIKNGYQHVFCSRVCFGRYVGAASVKTRSNASKPGRTRSTALLFAAKLNYGISSALKCHYDDMRNKQWRYKRCRPIDHYSYKVECMHEESVRWCRMSHDGTSVVAFQFRDGSITYYNECDDLRDTRFHILSSRKSKGYTLFMRELDYHGVESDAPALPDILTRDRT